MDKLILVDEQDNQIGFGEKIKCHQGAGKRHRAFSVFIFDKTGRLLIQKRANEKMLWPGYWANSCCSHPRQNEIVQKAAVRRLREELGLKSDLRFVFKFRYAAKFKKIGSEREYCHVLAGRYQGKAKPNPEEIAECKFIDYYQLQKDIKKNSKIYSPWFKIELKKMRILGFDPVNLSIKKIK